MSALVASAGWALAAAAWAEVRRRRRLVARACHELRGPLTAARLGLHLAVPAAGPLLVVERELRRAARMLDDLQTAPGGRGPDQRPGLVDAVALASEAARAAEPVAERHGASIAVAAPSPARAWVRGDRDRLLQACVNLLVNAAEHGRGPVRLRVRMRDGRVRIGVEDAGAGLPAPLGHLLRQHGTGRHGHGLAVAASVAARHGGRLASAPGERGATLVLDLPAAPAPARLLAEPR